MDKQMCKALEWKKSENKVIVCDQFVWSISWVSCAAASFKMDYFECVQSECSPVCMYIQVLFAVVV